MALTTAARVKQRLAIADDSAGVDITASEIDSLITEMESYTARFCGLAQWETAAYDETHSGTGDDTLFLKVPYMTSVSSVTVLLGGGDSTTIGSDAYRLDTESATLILTGGWDGWYGTYGCWPEGWRNIRVQGTGGLTSVPSDLTHALTEIVVTALLDRHTALSTASSAQDGVQRQIKSPADLVQSYAHLLAPYRRTYA
jgi:hypothetical protein